MIKKSFWVCKNLRNTCDYWRQFYYISAEMGGGSSTYVHNYKTFSQNGTSYYDTGS